MSIFNHLQLQEIDGSYSSKDGGTSQSDDEIRLNEQVDESSLDAYWDKVVKDIHKDPEWFTFTDE